MIKEIEDLKEQLKGFKTVLQSDDSNPPLDLAEQMNAFIPVNSIHPLAPASSSMLLPFFFHFDRKLIPGWQHWTHCTKMCRPRANRLLNISVMSDPTSLRQCLKKCGNLWKLLQMRKK